MDTSNAAFLIASASTKQLPVLVPIVTALLGAIIGATATWLGPIRTGRISKIENDRLAARKEEKEREEKLEKKEKRHRDGLFDRMVVLRNETRVHVLELRRLRDLAEFNSDDLMIPTSAFTAIAWHQGSTCADIARSVGRSYPEVEKVYYEYTEELTRVQDNLRAFQRRLHSKGHRVTRKLHREFLEIVERNESSLDEKRENLKGELLNAAQHLGYRFVLDEEWNDSDV
ncbi:hypothetical protein AB0M68_05515 [Streptomyces sp. NPDC051453]|uniref:hypothetical protein n=1 Tax=Streptomyces sp. NPDC051453 TaxID=3154941 RepID=UPI003439F731